MEIEIKISPGELVDRLSILEIKYDNIIDEVKRKFIYDELVYHRELFDRAVSEVSDVVVKKLLVLYADITRANAYTWNLIDLQRRAHVSQDHEKARELAEQVMSRNDMRFQVKNAINALFESKFREQKDGIQYDIENSHSMPDDKSRGGG